MTVAMLDVRSSKTWGDVEVERYLSRRRRAILSDPGLTARQKQLLLDEEVLTTKDIQELFGQESEQAVWQWRSPRDPGKVWPHPSVLPTKDKDLGEVGNKVVPGVQAGRALEWGIQSGRFRWDPVANDYVRTRKYRHGRPWSDVVRTRATTDQVGDAELAA